MYGRLSNMAKAPFRIHPIFLCWTTINVSKGILDEFGKAPLPYWTKAGYCCSRLIKKDSSCRIPYRRDSRSMIFPGRQSPRTSNADRAFIIAGKYATMGISPHISPPFYCDDAMPHPVCLSLGQSAHHSDDYAYALFGRERHTGHDLSPSRYERW